MPPAEAAIYAKCMQTVSEVRRQRTCEIDPTNAAMHFDCRRNASRAAFYNFPIQTQVGPL